MSSPPGLSRSESLNEEVGVVVSDTHRLDPKLGFDPVERRCDTTDGTRVRCLLYLGTLGVPVSVTSVVVYQEKTETVHIGVLNRVPSESCFPLT